ncbi:hypothetical protein TorRG33x02_194360, partial [Trema orientale]
YCNGIWQLKPLHPSFHYINPPPTSFLTFFFPHSLFEHSFKFFKPTPYFHLYCMQYRIPKIFSHKPLATFNLPKKWLPSKQKNKLCFRSCIRKKKKKKKISDDRRRSRSRRRRKSGY